MVRKNVYSAQKEDVIAHGGAGKIRFARPFSAADFETDLSFIDYVEIPPGSSIGVHTHGENEEVYFIVRGKGIMITNGTEYRVEAGDLIVNQRGWTHGLRNDTSAPLHVLVWEIAYTKGPG
jgi:mannose-6-phosphate isomerase-like protein (cupin superfamily)